MTLLCAIQFSFALFDLALLGEIELFKIICFVFLFCFKHAVCAVHGEEDPVVCLLGRLGHFVFSRPRHRSSHFPSLLGKRNSDIKYRYVTTKMSKYPISNFLFFLLHFVCCRQKFDKSKLKIVWWILVREQSMHHGQIGKFPSFSKNRAEIVLYVSYVS